jgi:HlyD family secretion protein
MFFNCKHLVMDIPRANVAKSRRKRRIAYAALAAAALVAGLILLFRLKPAVPSVDRGTLWIDTVKRGSFGRQVHGLGTLVPQEIDWIAARDVGRVQKILLRPGATVEPDSIILVLRNPDVEQAATDAEVQYESSLADLTNFKNQVERDELQAESDAASAKSDYDQARLKADVDSQLFKDGLISPIDQRLSQVASDEALARNTFEQKRLALAKASMNPQIAVKEAEVARLRSQARLRRDEADALTVRAGIHGVLQLLPIDTEGALVQPGTNIAEVADPTTLKAEVAVAETQARDIQIGQAAEVDTHNGVVKGHVSRIDPSVQNGTVSVDIVFSEPLPKGARPDLSVDGTIDLEYLADVVYVGRPAFGEENSSASIFKLTGDGAYAQQTQVQLGRSSVNAIEIVKGLEPGDRVILSDMSQWSANDRIKLN